MRQFVRFMLIAALIPAIACSKDAPEDEEYCLRDSYKIPLDVHVDFEPTFVQHKSIDSLYFKTRTESSEPYLKYYVAAFPMTEGIPTTVASSTDNNIRMEIHPGRYTMVGWVMYESDDKSHGYNFYDDDFSELLLKNKYSYSGSHPYKIAYRASEAKNIAYNTTHTSLTALPAMGHYKLIATDSAKFVPSKVIVRYTSSLPAAIHGKTGNINWWWNDISYDSEVAHIDSLGDILASDFVLSHDKMETSVTATIEIFDEYGNLKARKKNINIPLKNGGLTTIKGSFYSFLEVDEDATSGSGINIKTEWDATFEIQL
ncbi:MAG: DUF4433 domain-containing protein [Lachnospiraceae bacterium]|nr:DUF4433 domain-containing protein [Lachnospiraceae bacterium]